MTTYYVSKNGNDSNNGLGPDASHASNKPWLTIGKALGASGISAGDTVYVGPGVYREQVTVGFAPGSNVNVFADPTNSQGFKDGSGVRVTPTPVRWTNYNTDDKTAPTATALLTMSSRSNFTFEKFSFVDGANVNCLTITNGSNITFNDCAFNLCGGSAGSCTIGLTLPVDTNANWNFNRCIFLGVSSATQQISVTLPTSASADYDCGLTFTNCIFWHGTRAFLVTATGANSFKGGGVDCNACSFLMQATVGFHANSANLSTSIPCTVNNSLLITTGTALSANTSGQVTEDYNRIVAGTARTNVSAGSNSLSSNAHALLLEFGQHYFQGRQLRPYFSPTKDSPLLAFGALTSPPSVDIFNRPKPSGGGLTWASINGGVGAMEFHDIAARETGTVDAGSNAIVLVGPGDQDIHIPVDAASTTISIKARYDSNHDTTNKPQAILLANGEIGVSTETKTMTAAVDTWETLTFSSFTPTAKGWVTVRLVSRAAAGNGKAFFDTLSVT